jgi:hypothetical protein
MDRPETFIVRAQDERPARPDGNCFYCHMPMDTAHRPECVIVQKTVVVEFSVRVVMSVPRSWEPTATRLRYDEGSWCADNLFTDLGEWAEDDLGGDRPTCGCNAVKVLSVEDATEGDHRHFPVLFKPED